MESLSFSQQLLHAAPGSLKLTTRSMRWLEYIGFLALVVVLAQPVGLYLARVFERRRTFFDPMLRPAERLLHRWLGVNPRQEMSAGRYTRCFLLFSAVSTAGLFVLLLAQRWLPGGPAGGYLTTPMTADLAANTAISFSTTTTWQAYGGETTLRYLTQLLGLVSQNFLAGAAGLALGIAFIRGFARAHSATVGNFWVDLVRALLWVLLPAGGDRQPRLGLAGRAAQPGALHAGPHFGRWQSDHRSGTGGGAGVHQEPGNQRRRLLQCQWRPSL